MLAIMRSIGVSLSCNEMAFREVRRPWPALLAALVLSPRMDTSDAVPFDPPMRTVV